MLDGTRRSSDNLTLHVYGRDDTKIIVYSMGRWPKEGGSEKSRNLCNNTLNSCNFVHQQDIIT